MKKLRCWLQGKAETSGEVIEFIEDNNIELAAEQFVEEHICEEGNFSVMVRRLGDRGVYRVEVSAWNELNVDSKTGVRFDRPVSKKAARKK